MSSVNLFQLSQCITNLLVSIEVVADVFIFYFYLSDWSQLFSKDSLLRIHRTNLHRKIGHFSK